MWKAHHWCVLRIMQRNMSTGNIPGIDRLCLSSYTSDSPDALEIWSGQSESQVEYACAADLQARHDCVGSC